MSLTRILGAIVAMLGVAATGVTAIPGLDDTTRAIIVLVCTVGVTGLGALITNGAPDAFKMREEPVVGFPANNMEAGRDA